MEKIYGTKNENIDCYSFKDTGEKELDKIEKHCKRCRYFDDVSDFPNRFCDLACELIDYHFCLPKCPLKKWEIVDDKGVKK